MSPKSGAGYKFFMRGERLIYLLLAIVVAYDLFRAITHVLGPTMLSEDFAYIFLAFNALHGNINIGSAIDATRILQYLPIALFYKLFGVGIYTSSAWNVLMYISTVIIAFFVGKEVYNAKAGLVAALLLGFFTPVVKNSVSAGINETMMLFISLTMLAVLYGHNKHSSYWMFAAGILAIVTQLSIPIGLIALISAAIYVMVEYLRHNTSRKLVAWFFFGIVVAGAAVVLFSYADTGNLFVIIHQNGAYYSNLSMTDTSYGIIGSVPSHFANGSANNLIYYLDYYPQQMLTFNIIPAIRDAIVSGNLNPIAIWDKAYRINTSNYGLYFYAVLIAALILLILQEKRLYFPLLWLAVGMGFLEFAPMSVSFFPFRYVLSFRALRYTTGIAVPIAVILAIAVMRIIDGGIDAKGDEKRKKMKRGYFNSSARFVAGAIVVAVLIATSVPLNNAWYNNVYSQTYPLRVIANYLNGKSNATRVYVPTTDYYFISVYMHYNNMSRINPYYYLYNCTYMAAGAYLIVPNASSGWVPATPAINNTEEFCPGLKLIMEVNASLAATRFIGWPPSKYEQRLYYVN